MTNPTDIAAELERLAEIATPGPWKAGRPDMLSSAVYAGGEVGEMGKYVYREPDVHLAEVAFPAFHIPEPNSIADAQLIVFLRNHHAEIIAALRAAGEVERMREATALLAQYCDDYASLSGAEMVAKYGDVPSAGFNNVVQRVRSVAALFARRALAGSET